MNIDALLDVLNKNLDEMGRPLFTKAELAVININDAVPDSLDLLQIAMALEDASGKPVDVQTVMKSKTILELLEQIASH